MDAGTPTSAARRAAIRWHRSGDNPPTAPRGHARRVVDIGLVIVGVGAALVLFALAAALTVVPAFVGGHALTVMSGSMAPALRPGSIAVDRPVDPTILHVGDVITFTSLDQVTGAPETVTHRVVRITDDVSGPLFTTKGDANDVTDEQPVRADQIHGRLWYDVPLVGYVRGALRSRGLLMVAGGIVLLSAGGWLLRWSGWPGSGRRDRT